MKQSLSPVWRYVTAFALVAIVWLLGWAMMQSAIGDPLMRLSYDTLHVAIKQPPVKDVVMIALTETTDRNLGRKQGELFSRNYHARLLNRLKKAGAKWVCYDIIFDLESTDAKADDAFATAISTHGKVVLGGVLGATTDNGAQKTVREAPYDKFLKMLALPPDQRWGLVNVSPPDNDGVIRQFNPQQDSVKPSMALVLTRSVQGDSASDSNYPSSPVWMNYPFVPGDLTTLEFSDCLNLEIYSDDRLANAVGGKTVFIGGEYNADTYGRGDWFPTPYTRFGAREVSGMAWHAMAYLNLRDRLWLESSGTLRNLFWAMPLGFCVLVPLLTNLKYRYVSLIWIAVGVATSVACFYSLWNDNVMVNWLVPLLVQVPLCFGVMVSYHLAKRAGITVMAPQPKALEKVDVFISFSSKDLEVAEQLKEFLDHNGHPAWLCNHNINEGSTWAGAIMDAILKCRVVVFILSKNSLESGYCLDEVIAAKNNSKPIIPMRIDNALLKGEFQFLTSRYHQVDGRSLNPAEIFPVVFSAVEREMGKKTESGIQSAE